MINAYDFDGTIYDGDSSVDFYFYCLKKNKKVLLCLFTQLYGFLVYIFRIKDKTYFKERVFSFLKYIDDVDSYVSDFWKSNLGKIKPWYLEQHDKSDLIISASPEFLLKPLEKELDIKVIASRVDKKSGKFAGLNCHDIEKVERFNAEVKGKKISKFYSDSMSDKPMMDIAEEAYFVKKNTIYKLNENGKEKCS